MSTRTNSNSARAQVTLLLAGLLLLCSCAPTWTDGMADPGELTTENQPGFPGYVAPRVVVLEEEPCFDGMEFVDGDRRDLLFHFVCDAASIDIVAGDVVAGVWEGCYLGRVHDLAVTPYTLRLKTTFISLAEAVGDGAFELNLTDDGARSSIDLSGKTIYRSTQGGLHVESGFRRGYLNISPETQLDGVMQWGRLERFDAVIGLRAAADFEYYIAASGAHRIDEEVVLEEANIPFAFTIDTVPFAGRLKLEFLVRIVSETTGYVDMTVGSYAGQWNWEAGGRHRKETGWERVWENNWSSEVEGMEMVGDTGWNGRIEFMVRPSISFYEAIGIEGTVGTYMRGNADPECEGIDWIFYDGIRASMGLSVAVLDRLIPDMPLTVPMGTTERLATSQSIPWPGGLPDALEAYCGGASSDTGLIKPITTYCNETVSGDTSDPEMATQLLNGYACNVGNYAAPEVVYAWTAPADEQVTFRLVDPSPTEVNHDLFVLSGDDPMASPIALSGSCLETGLNSLVFEAEAGRNYLFVVDGYAQDQGAFDARLDCSLTL